MAEPESVGPTMEDAPDLIVDLARALVRNEGEQQPLWRPTPEANAAGSHRSSPL